MPTKAIPAKTPRNKFQRSLTRECGSERFFGAGFARERTTERFFQRGFIDEGGSERFFGRGLTRERTSERNF